MADFEGLVRDVVVKTWDQTINDTTPAGNGKTRRQVLCDALEDLATLLEQANPANDADFNSHRDAIFKAAGFNQKISAHLSKDWFPKSGGFFPDYGREEKAMIVAKSYLEAMHLADDTGLPIHSTWVCLWLAGATPPPFQTSVHKDVDAGRIHVQIFAFVKNAPNHQSGRDQQDRVIWVGRDAAIGRFKRVADVEKPVNLPNSALTIIDTEPNK